MMGYWDISLATFHYYYYYDDDDDSLMMLFSPFLVVTTKAMLHLSSRSDRTRVCIRAKYEFPA